ncbi:hypothetical protein ACFQZ4_42095 [Catellatospora coxensis]|uniref:Uncharacterized protein n=1 Tax=Catellatospora coxensis TaxID=310354 RepID=A0A8J3L1V2_9ACTN|nr:hypothetical protein [Catellatospora coxensis]GIG10462.1 hypothetical protein Cco03nite_71620 [Catellatospora coxensis]
MLRSPSLPPLDGSPARALDPMSPGTVPWLGLAMLAIGGWLLWRARRPANPSRVEERRGGAVFAVLGAVIGVAGLIGLWLD